jgi:hypothetical protein
MHMRGPEASLASQSICPWLQIELQ